jgi:hypothetical protein
MNPLATRVPQTSAVTIVMLRRHAACQGERAVAGVGFGVSMRRAAVPARVPRGYRRSPQGLETAM